jgi:hypothetical protein
MAHIVARHFWATPFFQRQEVLDTLAGAAAAVDAYKVSSMSGQLSPQTAGRILYELHREKRVEQIEDGGINALASTFRLSTDGNN